MRSLRTAAATAVCGLIVIGSTAPGAEQQPAPPEPIRSPSPLRISVELVQIDATVTDQNGRHVTNLDAADFEVLQDNRPQTISAFQYVPAGAAPRIPGERRSSGRRGQCRHSRRPRATGCAGRWPSWWTI